MTILDPRQPFAHGALLRAVACAGLLIAIPTSAIAGPRLGFELVAQHAREETNEWFEPEGFPVSGSATLTLRWVPIGGLDLVTGLGYEDRLAAGEVYLVTFYGGPYGIDVQRQWRSVVVPVHARVALGPHVRFEAGPEWRWLIQARSRSENVIFAVPYVAGAQTDFGPWYVGTSSYDRSSFAVAFGLGVHWPWFRGDAGVGFRWCEGLGNQLDSDWQTSHFREFQLVTSWDR